MLASHEAEIVECMVAETGAKRDWATLSNVRAGVALLRDVATLANQIKGEVIPSLNPGTTTLVLREPAGVVLAIAPWNAPVILSCRAVAVALVCGNSVILKSSECSPRTQRFVVEAFREAGLPDGVLNYVNMAPDESVELTEMMIKDSRVRRVNFTGSDRVGRIIASLCGKHGPKQCLFELGGKAPAIVLEDADVENAADCIVFSSMMHSGQICFSTENVIAVGSVGDKIVEAIEKRIKRLWSGKSEEGQEKGREEKFRLGPLFKDSAAAKAVELLKNAQESGAKVLVGDLKHNGCFVQPHLIDNVPPTSRLFAEETFAPVCAVIRVKDVDEAIKLANQTDFSLSAGVYGSDGTRTLDVAKRIKSGAVHVNGPTVSVESNRPYGGCGGSSGYGRFGGTAGIEEYTDRKVVTLNTPGKVLVSLV